MSNNDDELIEDDFFDLLNSGKIQKLNREGIYIYYNYI